MRGGGSEIKRKFEETVKGFDMPKKMWETK